MESKNQIDLLFCSLCRSSGIFEKRKCKQCSGLGAAFFKRNKVLFWKYPLGRYALALAEGKKIFNKIRFITVLLLGLNSWLWSGFFLYRSYSLYGRLEVIPDLSKLLFWSGCVCLIYAWYRAIVQRSHSETVESFDYNSSTTDGKDTWLEMLKTPNHFRRNIAFTFTEEALGVIRSAYKIADKQGTEKLRPLHLFLALLESNRIANAFVRLGVSSKYILEELTRLELLKNGPGRNLPPHMSEEVIKIFFDAYETAYNLHQKYVSVTELFTATITSSKQLQEILFDIGMEEQKLVNVIEWARIRERLTRRYTDLKKAGKFRSKQGMDKAMTAVATPFLNRMSEDITLRAQFGGVEMCVGREKEIEEVFQVIEGGEHNVLLVGDYGVGKRSLVFGIAEKMIDEDVPSRLFDKRLVQLSIPSLLSGTTPSGAAERLIMVFNEIQRAGNVILFINNIHELLGISLGSDDKSLDIGSELADLLTRGDFVVVAATTPDAYAKAISNSKLSAAFTKVEVNEFTEDGAIQVLESKAGYIEFKEKIFFAYEAISKAVELAKRFVRETPLPGSALEILTEAAAYGRKKKGAHSLISANEVGMVVSEKTNVPLTAISGDESEKLLHLEEEMHQRVIGQDEAVRLVAGALRRARAEIRSQKKPIANFLFLGPTGVGKTELAKTIAEVYFGGESNMIRLDMSEFQDTDSIYRLIGEPGKKGTGMLTEAVKRKPFSLLLLDEIEKADKDVLNLFLQVMDDGRLTDSIGKVVDFTNVILIATSNAGTAYVQEQLKAGVGQEVIKEKLLHGGLKEYFRPEFLNRFDGIVLFEPLSEESVGQITSLLLSRISRDLEVKGIKMKIGEGAVGYFASVGFDPEFGARPLRRVLQEKVENQLAELLIGGKLRKRDTVVIGEGGKIVVE